MAQKKISGEVEIKRDSERDLAGTVSVTGDIANLISRASDPAVSLRRSQRLANPDLFVWWLIRQNAADLSFENYLAFMDYVLCGKELPDRLQGKREGKKILDEKIDDDADGSGYFALKKKRFLPFTDTDAYRLLKVATEAFLMVNCCVKLDDIPEGITNELLHEVSATTEVDLQAHYLENYLKEINGTTDKTLPYLALIMKKFPELSIKSRIFKDFQSKSALHRGSSAAEECYGILQEKLAHPCLIELIWSYWHEQGMLVQTMNTISRRFQNIRGPQASDPLAMLELDPLRPLNNLLWGYVQDEQHRLSLVRRTYEYDHHYGLTLSGKAVPELRPADSRSRFLEGFHNLFSLTSAFYKQDDDTTVVADGFPILNALRDVHMLLAEGAHNQFGDLPVTARMEMMMQQWLLARPEFREVLPTRIMVAYPEPWMDRVDAMKKLQGWTDTSILHFYYLATYGEQILLSIRYGSWSEPTVVADQAAVWARFWRSQIQGYIHAYRTVTGVDLAAEATNPQDMVARTAQPSTLLLKRLTANGARGLLPQPQTPTKQLSFRERRAARK